jgi:putative acetyltransferase
VATIIKAERPDSLDASQLIAELEDTLIPLYPQESRHGYSIEKLIQEEVPFFVLHVDSIAAACGGVKLFGREYGEIKRMFVRPQFRGLGFGKLILNYLAEFSLGRGVRLLRLETGIFQPEAIGLYKRMGFHHIPPFGEYREDPLSLFFEKEII